MAHDDIRKAATQLTISMGRDLAPVRFFKPTPKFLDWMGRIYGKALIYDVGAGCGHVTKALLDKRLKVLAIDINSRDEQDAYVMMADGEDYCYSKDSVVMICRPCHGEFVERVITQAIQQGAAAVLYVGLGKNVKDDLGRYLGDFKKVLSCAGRESEFVMRWKRTARSVASSPAAT